jgi:serine phosphatase RsbU (regulator of sigma subunit)
MFWRKKDQSSTASGASGGSGSIPGGPTAPRQASEPARAASKASEQASDMRSSFLLGSDLSDRQRLDALFEAITRVTDTRSMSTTSSGAALEDLLAYLVDRAVEFARAERGFLILPDVAGDAQSSVKLVALVARGRGGPLPSGTRFPNGLVRKLLADGAAVCTQLDMGSSILDMKLRAVMAVRLDSLRTIDGAAVPGVLYVDTRQMSRAFSPGDLRFFQTLSAFVAVAVRNAEFRAALVQKAQQDREFEIVKRIRDDLNPEPIEDHPAWEVAAWAEAEQTASGDFYDWSALPGGRLAVQCGDVAGHGVGSALIMASAASATRAHVRYSADPAEIIARVARDLQTHVRTKHLTTFLALFDAQGAMRAINAGHTPPMHWRKDGSIELLPDEHNLAIGFDPDHPWQALPERNFAPGEMLVLVSDGLTEARAPGTEELLGEDGLSRLVAQAAPRATSAADMVRLVREAWLAYTGGALYDDTTLVVVRRRG